MHNKICGYYILKSENHRHELLRMMKIFKMLIYADNASNGRIHCFLRINSLCILMCFELSYVWHKVLLIFSKVCTDYQY